MAEEKPILAEVAADSYDAADRPFVFLEANVPTALICESNELVRKSISDTLKALDYQITEPVHTLDALKRMRFHVYDLVVINENFDSPSVEENGVLRYMKSLAIYTRRQIFVVLISNRFQSTDNMAAFNNSVNVVFNTENVGDFCSFIKAAVEYHSHFYQVFKDSMKKTGRA